MIAIGTMINSTNRNWLTTFAAVALRWFAGKGLEDDRSHVRSRKRKNTKSAIAIGSPSSTPLLSNLSIRIIPSMSLFLQYLHSRIHRHECCIGHKANREFLPFYDRDQLQVGYFR